MRKTKVFKTLTDLDRQILTALREAGDWQSRQQLAERIGRKYLTAYSALRLEMLTHQELVETRRIPLKQGKPQYEYRVVINHENESKG
jgi:predicted transcriptional regulator